MPRKPRLNCCGSCADFDPVIVGGCGDRNCACHTTGPLNDIIDDLRKRVSALTQELKECKRRGARRGRKQ